MLKTNKAMKTMKHLFGALPLAALALTFTACGNDETFDESGNKAENNLVTMTFTANAPVGAVGTRTSLVDGTQVYWTPSDEIGIYSCTSNNYSFEGLGNLFRTDLSAAAPTATFTGTAEADALQYIAVYPQDMFTACMWSSEQTMLGFTLPTVQTAEAGGFASGLNPSLAATNNMEGNLTFKNLCALVKFHISGGDTEGLKSVTLTDLGDVGLSGRVGYSKRPSWEADGTIEERIDAEIPSVTLTGSFASDADYYFVVAPSNNALKGGFSLTFTREDGSSFTKTASNGIGETDLTAGMILDLGKIDLSGATYLEAITNTAFIEAVGNQVGWEKEVDGTVLLTDENKAAIEKVAYLDVSGKGLTDLSGIEYFTGLTNLNCNSNFLTSLNVSGLTSLTNLQCHANQLTSLDLSGLTSLTNLYCQKNSLQSLKVSGLAKLSILNCFDNSLTSLDLSGLTSLSHLFCNENQLTSLDLSKLASLEQLECNDNSLISLIIGNLTNLTKLNCSGNQLLSLDVSNLTGLTTLDCSKNQLTSLIVGGLTALTELYCNDNQLAWLIVSGLTALTTLNCYKNQLISLDVSELTALTLLRCYSNQLTSLDITKLSLLKALRCGSQNIDGNMTLYLTSRQQSKWEDDWLPNLFNNENVTPVVQ